MVAVQIRYDPFDASILSDPYPTYRLLRDAAPVYRAEESHTWVLSRHEDVQAAALDHGTYSSVDGIFPDSAGIGLHRFVPADDDRDGPPAARPVARPGEPSVHPPEGGRSAGRHHADGGGVV